MNNHWSDRMPRSGYLEGSEKIPPMAWIGAVVFFLVFFVAVPWLGNGAGF